MFRSAARCAGGRSDTELTLDEQSAYGISFAHNGNLINSVELKDFLDREAHRHVSHFGKILDISLLYVYGKSVLVKKKMLNFDFGKDQYRF